MFALLPVEGECVFYFEGRAGGGARQPAAGWGVSVQPGVQPSAAAAGQGHSSPVLRPHEPPAGEAASSHLGRPYWKKGPFQPEHWCGAACRTLSVPTCWWQRYQIDAVCTHMDYFLPSLCTTVCIINYAPPPPCMAALPHANMYLET